MGKAEAGHILPGNRIGYGDREVIVHGRGRARTAIPLGLLCLLFGCVAQIEPYIEGLGVVPGTQSGDPLGRYRRILLGPDPEPDGSQKQRLAIAALVRSGLRGAHQVLKDAVLSYGNRPESRVSDSVILHILTSLSEQLALDLDLKRLTLLAHRMLIYEGYIPVFVELIDWQDSAKCGFDDVIFDFFGNLPPEVARPVLKNLLSDTDRKRLRATVRVTGATRDPRMAKLLAPFLEQPDLKPLAQRAMAKLTLQATSFETIAEFLIWEKENGRKSYAELAMQAAHEGLELERKYNEARRATEKKFRAKVFELVKHLIQLSRNLNPPPWQAYYQLLTDDELKPDHGRIVESIYQNLRNRSLGDPDLKVSMAELVKLFDVLYKGYESSRPEDRKSWLSAYTLAARIIGGKTVREAEAELLYRLGNVSTELDDRIVELLTRFPRDRVRERVLGHLRNSLETRALAALSPAISCLGKLGAAEDSALANHTLDALETCVRDVKIPSDAREEAIEAIGGLKHRKAVPALRGFVNPGLGKLPEALRLKALAWVNTLVDTSLQATTGEKLSTQARDQLVFLLACLSDESTRLRKDAARELEDFPPARTSFQKTELRKISLDIVNEIGRSLRREEKTICIGQYREVLRHQAAVSEVAWDAVQQIVLTLEAWAKNERRSIMNEYLGEFEETLRQLLQGKGVQPLGTLGLAEKLIDVGLEKQCLILLASDVLQGLESAVTSGADAQERARAREIVKLRYKRAELLVRVVETTSSNDRLGKHDLKLLDQTLVKGEKGLRRYAREKPEALVYLGRALLNQGNAIRADAVLDEFIRGPSQDAVGPVQTLARQLRSRALSVRGLHAAAAVILKGLRDLRSQTLRADALLASRQWRAAERAYRDLSRNPAVPREGSQIENILLGLAESLLGQDKLEQFKSHVQSLPIEFKAQSSKDRYRLLLARQKARLKELEKKGKNASVNPGK
ncbi:MAG: hypothetical protein ACE5F1_09895 [Planctomycetota bacterium]